MVSEPTKVCANPECGRDLPLSEFYARSASPDGHQSWCKRCSREKRAEWAALNRKRLRELHQATSRRRQADPERAAIERTRKREWQRRKRGVRPECYRVVGSPIGRSTRLDARPFVSWLRSLGDTPAQISLVVGMSPDGLNQLLYGDRRGVEIDTVDRACLFAGIRIDDLYPLEVEAV